MSFRNWFNLIGRKQRTRTTKALRSQARRHFLGVESLEDRRLLISTPNMVNASDSGVSNSDDITFVTTPTFSGNGATPNGTVQIKEGVGGTVLGSGTANGSGAWVGGSSVTLSTALTEGVHNLIAHDVNSNTNSGVLVVTVDTTGPQVQSSTPSTAGPTTLNSINFTGDL